jgi:hypothetical protein
MDHAMRSSMAARVIAPGLAPWLAGLALALAALLAPAAVPTAHAADQLLLEADATYTVQPAQHRVHVAVDVRATSNRPPTAQFTYYYASAVFGIQAEATGVHASRAGQALRTKLSTKAGFKVLEVFFGSPLYYEHSTSFRFEYELPGGAPRSTSGIRVGAAFVSFYAWTFADTDSVRMVFPKGFEPAVSGSEMRVTDEAGRPVLSATDLGPADQWYVSVTADREAGLERTELSVVVHGSPESVSVGAWPEDSVWSREVTGLLTDGLPLLGDLIGLDWPLKGTLEISEVYTPLLEGYAGFYLTGQDRILISENLEDLVIVHEASHTWFNDRLFRERWISEGLANEYASRVALALTATRFDPDPADRASGAAFPLVSWGPPSAQLDDDAVRAREHYGYDASWTVMRELVRRTGEGNMRRVFAAAANDEIAYVGDGSPEKVQPHDDWRRLLDLVEERGDVDAADLFRKWVVPAATDAILDERAAARDAFVHLGQLADGWTPPYAVREPMSTWDFARADTRIAEAGRVLDRRDELERRAGTLDLTLPDALEKAYEGAQQDFGGTVVIADEEAGTLDSLEEAAQAVSAPRDPFAELGLVGDPDPRLALDAARAAFEDDQMAISRDDAGAAIAAVSAAPDRGRQRAAAGGAGILLLVIGGVSLAIVRRRRSGPGDEFGHGSGPAPAATLASTEATTERGNGEEH